MGRFGYRRCRVLVRILAFCLDGFFSWSYDCCHVDINFSRLSWFWHLTTDYLLTGSVNQARYPKKSWKMCWVALCATKLMKCLSTTWSGQVTNPNMKVRRAIRLLARQDLLDVSGSMVSLTEDGRHEARKLLRAHRLWETYLKRARCSRELRFTKQHTFWNILVTRATVDYLDDKLGHPLTDPHGSEIPEDSTFLRGNRQVPFSALREGRTAVVRELINFPAEKEVSIGETVTVGPRSDGGLTWTLLKSDGTQIQLSHEEADSILVTKT